MEKQGQQGQVSLSEINNEGVIHLQNGDLIKANHCFRRALQYVRRDLRTSVAESSASSSTTAAATTTTTMSKRARRPPQPKFIPTAGYSNLNLHVDKCGGGFTSSDSLSSSSSSSTTGRGGGKENGVAGSSLMTPTRGTEGIAGRSRSVRPSKQQQVSSNLAIYTSGMCIDEGIDDGGVGTALGGSAASIAKSRVCSNPMEDHKICASIVVYNNAVVLHLYAMALLKQERFDDDVALQARHLFVKAQTLYQQSYKLLIGVLVASSPDGTSDDDDNGEEERSSNGNHPAKRRRLSNGSFVSSSRSSSSCLRRNAAVDLLAMALVNNLAHIRLELCDYADSRRLLQLLISIAYSMQPTTYGCDQSLVNFMEWQRQLFLRNAAPNMHPLPAAAAA